MFYGLEFLLFFSGIFIIFLNEVDVIYISFFEYLKELLFGLSYWFLDDKVNVDIF